MTSDNPDEMLSAWTPGPWMASDARYPNRPIVRMARVNGAHGVFTKIADINAGLNEANANARLIAAAPDLATAAADALAGWRYIRANHGDLYGVGWDRVEQALSAALCAS